MIFADYYHLAQSATGADSIHGFRFRRIQLTYDADLDSLHAVRLTLEADETEQTTPGLRDAVFIKQAYLTRRAVWGLGSLFAGIAPTPLWRTSEQVWGYRSVEKTLLDRNAMGFPTDFGLALLAPPTAQRALGWHLMFANGAGPRRETNRAKRATLSVPLVVQSLVIEGVWDFEGGPADRDRYLLKLFAGWQGEHLGIGLETFRRVLKNSGLSGRDVAPAGLSVFGRGRLRGPWSGFLRYDLFDPDSQAETTGYREHFFLGGLDCAVTPSLHLIPNLAVRKLGAKDDALGDPNSDVEIRLTLFLAYP
jgi:hypothetical protein